MSQSIVLKKAFAFALRIVKLYQYLCDEKREFILSKNVLTAGTHIGKHIKEANAGESRQVFINEVAIALRKASETKYWLELLFQSKILGEKEFNSINADRTEIEKMLTSIVKTSKTQTS